MLVLTRKVGEKIVIGDDIVVMVCEIRSPEKVRIGIEAPREVTIFRGELLPPEITGSPVAAARAYSCDTCKGSGVLSRRDDYKPITIKYPCPDCADSRDEVPAPPEPHE